MSPRYGIWQSLVLSIVIDVVGLVSFLIPGVLEFFDIGWAPVSAYLLNHIYGNMWMTVLNFVEELSPGLDFIPSALIAWAYAFRSQLKEYFWSHRERRRE